MLAAAGGPSFRELLSEGRTTRLPLGWELLKALVGASNYTIPALGLALIEKLPSKLAPQRMASMVESGQLLKQRLTTVLADDGVLVFPCHPTSAPVHGMPLFRIPNFAYTSLWNVMEVPSTSVPCGLDNFGLPVGIQAS
jgi:fatty acid amide hydrolase 2